MESVGKNVSKFKTGDQVFGSTKLRFGAYGEFMSLPACYTLAPKPKNMDFESAASVPLGGLNALHFMRKAEIKKGESVLINGAGGSIGVFAVQIAKSMGAEVTAVDSTVKMEMLLDIGADHVIDYTKEDFTESGQTYDVIFDMVADSSYSASIGTLNYNGRYLKGNPRLSDMLRSILTSKLTPRKAIFEFAGETEEELLTLKQMIEEGSIKSVVDRVYPLAQASKAHQRVESEQRLGAVILSVQQTATPIRTSPGK